MKGLSKLLGRSSVKPDEELMMAVRNGDKAAFQVLFEKYRGPIMNYVFQMVRHQGLAEEMCQEVFLKVFRARETYSVEAKFTTWLWTIAKNTAYDHVRKKSEYYIEDIMPDGASENLESPVSDSEAQLLEKVEKARIEHCVNELGEKQKEAFLLRTFSELSYEEIAEQVGQSLAAVKSLLFRAKTHLMECLRRGGVHG